MLMHRKTCLIGIFKLDVLQLLAIACICFELVKALPDIQNIFLPTVPILDFHVT